ncbi:hypothetical protein QFZ66_005833 [Streptomyces sp. B4I13]|nr:hypothetical protein [Streptomyces sp. B4I13]
MTTDRPDPRQLERKHPVHYSPFRRLMFGLAGGLIAWAMTAFLPIVAPWAPVIGVGVALVLWS